MRDTISTPIIRYDGPPELRKSLEMEGRKFLGYVKGVLGGGLPYQKYVGRYNDGTTIEVQSISHVGELDIIKITVPVGGEEIVVKEEKRKRVEVVVQETEQIIPLLLEIPDASKMDEQSICSWDSPNFKTFLYFFKTPTARPIYALITPSPEEITVREFKDVKDYSVSPSEIETTGVFITYPYDINDQPNSLTVSYSNVWTEECFLALPTEQIKLGSMDCSYSASATWRRWVDVPWAHRTERDSAWHTQVGTWASILSSCYVRPGLWACLYIKETRENRQAFDGDDTGWIGYEWINPAPKPDPADLWDIVAAFSAIKDEAQYTLELIYRTDDSGVKTITLPPVWDKDSEWAVSQGYVAIYEEKVIVYSYLKTGAGGGLM